MKIEVNGAFRQLGGVLATGSDRDLGRRDSGAIFSPQGRGQPLQFPIPIHPGECRTIEIK